MNKTKLFSLILVLFALAVFASPALAVSRDDVRDARKNFVDTRKEFRQDVREKIATKVGALKNFFKSRMSIISGKITAINGTTLTVVKDGTTYTVATGTFDKCATKFRRRFWGSSNLTEYSVNDMVNVFGRWSDDTKTTVNACVIRDLSIQKRFGVFVGKVVSLTGNGWVMTTVSASRDNQTVTITSSTKLVNRKEQTITQADIKVGDKVRVKGMWDRANNTVTEVTHVKNYSLPVKPTVSVTATPTATPASTATPTATPSLTPTATPTP